MKQAYQHLTEGTTYYDHISDQIKHCVNQWNSTHSTKADIKTISNAMKTIFKYHHWIKVEDIEPSIELGLMGEFGENKGLNNETIFNWFKGYSRQSKANELKTHSAYQTEDTFISMEKRGETRKALITIFMKFYREYQETKVYNPKMNHYIPVFYQWFKNLKYIIIDDKKEDKIFNDEALMLRDLRSFFIQKEGDQTNTQTQKGIFIDAFILAADNDYPIEEQLKNQ